MKIMVRRACHHCFPTMSQLFHKQVTPDDICDICKFAREYASHAIFGCQELQHLWRKILPSSDAYTGSSPFLLQATKTNDKLGTTCLTTPIAVAWILWNRHNKWIYKEEQIHPTEAIEFAIAMQLWFSELRQQPTHNKQHYAAWKRPPENFLKLKVDGALFFDQLRTGIGTMQEITRGHSVLRPILEFQLSMNLRRLKRLSF